MFSEARFVFGRLGKFLNKNLDSLSGVAGTPIKAPTSAKAPAQKTARLKQERETTKKLSAMKLKMVERSLAFQMLDFEGKVFKVPFDKVNSKQVADALSAEVLAVLNSKSNEVALNDIKAYLLKVRKIEITTEEIKALAVSVYAGPLLHMAKGGSILYPRLSEYAKAMKIKDTGVEAELSYHARGEIRVKYTSKDPDLFKKYKKWEKTNKSKDAGKAKPTESISKPELDRFAKSPLGKIFGHLMGGKNGDKNWIDLMREGKPPPLALFIAGLFGYKIGADAYGGAVDMLPDKFKGRLKSFERKARNSRLSAKHYAKKHPRKSAAVGVGAESLDAKFFATAIEQNSIPKKGLKLSEDYVLKKGETLVVDLTGGGQVVLPKNAKAYVDGNLSDPGKVYKNVRITFSNTIPKGTVITGKVDLKRVAPKKAA